MTQGEDIRAVARGSGEGASGTSRVAALDLLRGVAVILMVAWHATDGWLALEHREGPAWSVARVVGGLAAPLFLLTAGASLGLGALRGRTTSRVAARGLALVALGFLLQLERWAVDRGAITEPGAWPALLSGALAGAAALVATTPSLRRRPAVARVPAPVWMAIAIALLLAHVACVAAFDAQRLVTTLRFDVLHCIGISTMICALAVRAAALPGAGREALSIAILAASALAIVLITPTVARAVGDTRALAWIARSRELRSVAPFPVLPWCGYAIAGCALSRAVLRAAWSERGAPSLSAPALTAIAGIAIFVAAVAFEGGPAWTRHALGVFPDARPLSRLVFHLSVATALACACGLVAGARSLGVVRDMGRTSLAIYALHVPLAYGALAEPLRRALSPSACALAATALVAACAAGAMIASRVRTRSLAAGGERAHMLARGPSFEANLRA